MLSVSFHTNAFFTLEIHPVLEKNKSTDFFFLYFSIKLKKNIKVQALCASLINVQFILKIKKTFNLKTSEEVSRPVYTIYAIFCKRKKILSLKANVCLSQINKN